MNRASGNSLVRAEKSAASLTVMQRFQGGLTSKAQTWHLGYLPFEAFKALSTLSVMSCLGLT
jgi:hypothetical protein